MFGGVGEESSLVFFGEVCCDFLCCVLVGGVGDGEFVDGEVVFEYVVLCFEVFDCVYVVWSLCFDEFV